MRKYAVVTGGSKGIGKAICLLLAKEGFHIATCARSQDDLDTLKKELGAFDVQVIVAKVDVGVRSQVKSFGEMVLQSFPKVDLLVNNAGVFLPGSVLEEDEENINRMFKVNVESAYFLTRVIVPEMIKVGKGHIFNLCSVASLIAYPNGGSYSISKFALLGYTKVLREELKATGVKVTAILPGATWSDSWKGADFPVSRLMQADDIAKSILGAYQLSDAAVVEEIVLRPQLGDL